MHAAPFVRLESQTVRPEGDLEEHFDAGMVVFESLFPKVTEASFRSWSNSPKREKIGHLMMANLDIIEAKRETVCANVHMTESLFREEKRAFESVSVSPGRLFWTLSIALCGSDHLSLVDT